MTITEAGPLNGEFSDKRPETVNRLSDLLPAEYLIISGLFAVVGERGPTVAESVQTYNGLGYDPKLNPHMAARMYEEWRDQRLADFIDKPSD